MTNVEAEKALERAALALYEMGFDGVQIMGTWMEGGLTKCSKKGAGNFYARLAMAREFVEHNTADDAASLIANKLDKPDDGDAWKAEPAT